MSVSLAKGGNVNLSKIAPGLLLLTVGLGWAARVTDGDSFDLDSSVFMLKADGKIRTDADFIFYNNLKSTCGSVVHSGDNRDGKADGDDETISVDLSKVPTDVERIVFAVTIHEAATRRQNFGIVSNAFIRVVNQTDKTELARYDLSEDASTDASMAFGELYRHNGEWKFRALGVGGPGGLEKLASSYGVVSA